jgi:hypothetical protein
MIISTVIECGNKLMPFIMVAKVHRILLQRGIENGRFEEITII